MFTLIKKVSVNFIKTHTIYKGSMRQKRRGYFETCIETITISAVKKRFKTREGEETVVQTPSRTPTGPCDIKGLRNTLPYRHTDLRKVTYTHLHYVR